MNDEEHTLTYMAHRHLSKGTLKHMSRAELIDYIEEIEDAWSNIDVRFMRVSKLAREMYKKEKENVRDQEAK